MLLTITTTAHPATDLGFLLHKHPARVQDVELSFGKAHVFYPEASAERCTAALVDASTGQTSSIGPCPSSPGSPLFSVEAAKDCCAGCLSP